MGIIERIHQRVDAFVWGADAERLQPLQQGVQSVMRLALVIGQDLSRGELSLRAMSLVYTTLLSVVPLLAVSFSVLKGFGVHNQLEPLLLNLVLPLGEQGKKLVAEIVGFVDNMRVGVLGAVGMSLLIYTVVSLMQKIEQSLNFIWHISGKRSIAQRFSEYLSVLLIGPVLVFSALGLTGSLMHTELMETLTTVWVLDAVIRYTGALLPYALVICAFTFIYVFVPFTRVRLGSALLGGAVAGLLWESVGWGFAAFVANSGKYTAIYSGFAIVILSMIWLYLSWLILLIGAAIAFYHQHPEYQTPASGRETLSSREFERLTLLAMIEIGRRHMLGQEPWTISGLTVYLAARATDIEAAVAALSTRKLIVATAAADPGYVPARTLERIMVYEVLEAIRNFPVTAHRLAPHPATVRAVDELLARIDGYLATRIDQQDLSSLIEHLTTAELAETASSPATPPLPAESRQHRGADDGSNQSRTP